MAFARSRDIRFVCLLPLLVGCSAEGGEANSHQAERLPKAPVTIERPANAPASGLQVVIGATPGPCGSTKAAEFLGRTWSREVEAALKERSGARDIEIAHVLSPKDAADTSKRPRRLNVLLNDSRQIIMMDCG
jgi:hypothetical protein